MKTSFFIAASFTAMAFVSGQNLRTNALKSSLAHFRKGESDFSAKNFRDAALEFQQALAADQDVGWTTVWSHINLGKIFDQTGQCQSALQEYAQALQTSDNTGGALDEVRAYIRSNTIAPFSRQPDTIDDYPTDADDYRPYLYHSTAPEYSREAQLAGLEGMVILHGVVLVDGTLESIRVSRSLGFGLDEKALEAVREWRYLPGTSQGKPVPASVKIEVEFRLPAKESRWHLIELAFRPADGDTRPVFLRASYPSGSGVRHDAIDDARLVAVMGRYATATLTFDVNEKGTPVNFVVEGASRPVWGQEAIGIVRNWRFHPGLHGDAPISVPCRITLVWGSRKLVSHPELELSDVSVVKDTFVDGCRTGH